MANKSPFIISPNLLPHADPRYQKWIASLKKRPPPWNKGKTSRTDERVRKISQTFKEKEIDNFKAWRTKMIKSGLIISQYPPFGHSVQLATLIGLVHGDGNIHAFPRTQKLTITLGLDKPKLIQYGIHLVSEVFGKPPKVSKYSDAKAVRITLYQKQIAERLGIPVGKRRFSTIGIPAWIWESNDYLVGCLKGLFEAEGSLSIHLPTCTYNFAFANRNARLLEDVYRALCIFGLHPERRLTAIRLRKRDEVKYYKQLIRFRLYWEIG